MFNLLLEVIVGLLIAGVVLWALSQFPIDPTIARIIRVCVIVIVAIWLIYTLFGLLEGMPSPSHRRGELTKPSPYIAIAR